MKNLIKVLLQFSGLIVFLILETVCLILVVNYNEEQHKIWKGSSSYFSGQLHERVSGLTDYFDLSKIADSLAAENARLYEQLAYSKYAYGELDSLTRDSLSSGLQYRYISAKITNKSINRPHNTITINKGKNHGIHRNMGVITKDGVVGVITNVSDRAATVMSLLNRQSRISAAIKRNGVFGKVVWSGSNSEYADLAYIPKHREVVIGDTIETSGYSTIFPPGVMIGIVDTFWLKSGSNFYSINLELGVDFSTAKYVQVIDNILQEEQLELEALNE